MAACRVNQSVATPKFGPFHHDDEGLSRVESKQEADDPSWEL